MNTTISSLSAITFVVTNQNQSNQWNLADKGNLDAGQPEVVQRGSPW